MAPGEAETVPRGAAGACGGVAILVSRGTVDIATLTMIYIILGSG